MINKPPELASDLDWMLQSGQVNQDVLAEALIDAWFDPIFRLSRAFFKDTDDAIYATIEIFITALLDIHHYKSDKGIQIWLFQIVLGVIERIQKEKRFHKWLFLRKGRRFSKTPVSSEVASVEPEVNAVAHTLDSLNDRDRILALLHYLMKLPLIDMAEIYKCEPESIQFRLQRGRSRLRREIEASQTGSDSLKTGYLERLFERVLTQLWSGSDYDPEFLSQIQHEILRQVLNRGYFRKTKVSYQEFGWISGITLVVILLIWGISNLIPTRESVQPDVQNIRSQVTAIPVGEKLPVISSVEKAIPVTLPLSFIHYIVLPGDSLELIAERLGVSVKNILEENNIAADESILPGQILVIRSGREQVAPKPASGQPVKMPTPLDLASDPYQIKKRIAESQKYYHAFWGEMQVFLYGPAGYVGPPRGYLVQILYSSPGNYLMVGGQIQGNPDSIYIINHQYSDQSEGVRTAYRLDEGGHWFFQEEAGIDQLGSSFQLKYSFEALDRVAQVLQVKPLVGSLEPISIEKVVGRDTLVTRYIDRASNKQARLWVDTNTGVILHKQHLSGSENTLVDWEVYFTNIIFDQEKLPEFLDSFSHLSFEPFHNLPDIFGIYRNGWPGEMTVGFDTPTLWMPPTHPPLSYAPAPNDFDASKSWLIFQYPSSYDYHSSRSLVEVFADDYFLGVVRFGNPWTMICDRSADGNKVAFVSKPDDTSQDAILNWFSLTDPKLEPKDVLVGITIKDLAFSPNSKLLAAFGTFDATGGVYIIDTTNQRIQRLMQLANAYSLTWSPDNEYLAMIGRLSDQDDYELFLVLRLSDGEIAYSSIWNEDASSLLPDAPVLNWDVPFPTSQQGLDGCTQPQYGNK